MRIAVPAEGDGGITSTVSHHFGRCPFFVLVEVEEGTIGAVEKVDNPFFGSHAPGQVPGFLHEQNADLVLTGGMGQRALAFFAQYGIEICSGATGTVQEAVTAWLDGRLRGFEPCAESVRHAGRHDHGSGGHRDSGHAHHHGPVS